MIRLTLSLHSIEDNTNQNPLSTIRITTILNQNSQNRAQILTKNIQKPHNHIHKQNL